MNFPVADTGLVAQLNSTAASAAIPAQGDTAKPQSNFADILAALPHPNALAKELTEQTPLTSGADDPEADSDPTLLNIRGKETATTSRSATGAVETTGQPAHNKELPQSEVASDVPQRLDVSERPAPTARPSQSTPELLHGLTLQQPARAPAAPEPASTRLLITAPEYQATGTPPQRGLEVAESLAPPLNTPLPQTEQKTNSTRPTDAPTVATEKRTHSSVSDVAAMASAELPKAEPAVHTHATDAETGTATDTRQDATIAQPTSPQTNPEGAVAQAPASGVFENDTTTRTAEFQSKLSLLQQASTTNSADPGVKPVKLPAVPVSTDMMTGALQPQSSSQPFPQQNGSTVADRMLEDSSLKTIPPHATLDRPAAQTSDVREQIVVGQLTNSPARQPADVRDQNATPQVANSPPRQPADFRDRNATAQGANAPTRQLADVRDQNAAQGTNAPVRQPTDISEGVPASKGSSLAERPAVPLLHEPRLPAPQPAGLSMTGTTVSSNAINSSSEAPPQANSRQNNPSAQSIAPVAQQFVSPSPDAGADMASAKEPPIATPQPPAPAPTQAIHVKPTSPRQQQPASSGQSAAPPTAAVQIGVAIPAQAPSPAQGHTRSRPENVGRREDSLPAAKTVSIGASTTNQPTPPNTWAPTTPAVAQAVLSPDQLAKAEQAFSLLAPSEPSDILNWESVRQLVPQPGTQQPLRADLAPQIARQMAEAMPSAGQRPVEIALSPAELGRVRMSISTDEGSVTVNILAERPETLDLMRRHIDQLGQTFRSMGYDQITFAFGQGADTGDQAANGEGGSGAGTAVPSPDDLTTEQIATETTNPLNAGTTGVDIRL